MKPEKLNIALIRQKYRPDGGAERFLMRAMEALEKQGINMTIFTRDWHSQDNVSVIKCNPFKWGRVSRESGFAKSVCREIKKHKFDIIQSHERIPCCDIYRAGDGVHREWLQQRQRTMGSIQKLLLHISPFHRYAQKAEMALYSSNQLKAVICISQMVKNDILRYFDIPEEKQDIIYVGVDTTAFSPAVKQHRQQVREQLNIPQDAPMFLFVGSGFERKGIIQAIEALPSLPQETRLVVVGKDKKISRFKKRCAQLNVTNQVHFMGLQKDVKTYYGAADALVFPTRYEPFSNVVLEALSCGLPVITTTQCGGGELIENGYNGYTVDALDTPGLIKSMNALINKQHCLNCSINARKTAEPHTIEKVSQQLVSLYQNVLNRTTPND